MAGSAPSFELFVNGEPMRLAPGSTVADLVDRLALGDRKIAVAVNRTVVPRARHAHHRVQAGDRIEILEAVGGG